MRPAFFNIRMVCSRWTLVTTLGSATQMPEYLQSRIIVDCIIVVRYESLML
jgi:hypothetical protein